MDKYLRVVGLLGAKKHSDRLRNKGWRDFCGKPLFKWNVEKGIQLFNDMYVTSDHDFILEESADLGAIPIKRTDPKMMECSNIEYYRHVFDKMNNPDIIIAIQVNSPTIDIKLIRTVKDMMIKYGLNEIKTCHADYSAYGSIWAISKKRLWDYKDFYKYTPDLYIVDKSIDIHTQKDFDNALKEI